MLEDPVNISGSVNKNYFYSKTGIEPLAPALPQSRDLSTKIEEVQENNRTAQIKKEIHTIKTYYADSFGPPHMFQIFLFPTELMQNLYGLMKAVNSSNREAALDLKMRICKTITNSSYSFFCMVEILSKIGSIFSYLTFGSAHLAPATGILACAVTGTIDCKNIQRQHRFLKTCEQAFVQLEKGPVDLKTFDFLTKYIGSSKEVSPVGLAKLSARVKPWLAEKFCLEAPQLLEVLRNSQDPLEKQKALQQMACFLRDLKTQAQKKLLQKSLSLFGTTLLAATFATLLCGVSYWIPTALFLFNIVLITGIYIFTSGILEHAGWEFKPKECIPESFKKYGLLKV